MERIQNSVACMKCISSTKRHLKAIPDQGTGIDEQIKHNCNEADTCSGGSSCCKVTVLEGFTSIANQLTCCVHFRPMLLKTYAPKGVRLCNEHIGNSNLKSGLELSNNQPLTLGHNNDKVLLILIEIIRIGKSYSSSEPLTSEECKIRTG